MKNLANKITIIRMLMIPIFLLFSYTGHRFHALSVFFLACLSDVADGYIARRYHQISNFGKFMDPLADKVLVLSAMCFFVEKGIMPGWIVAIVIFREFSVSGLRLIASTKNIILAASVSGKIKTICTMGGICLLLVYNNIPWLRIFVSYVIVLTTLLSGAEYFIKNLTVFKDGT